jgi:glycosyltransferase involved in cell wall biosynthesis
VNQPTISVVIPCYNAAEFIKKTIQSALEQTLAPIEIIVVDDGSTDDSANLADELGSKIRTMRQPNQGSHWRIRCLFGRRRPVGTTKT